MTKAARLRQAIENAQSWRPIRQQDADANTIDVYDHAEKVANLLKLKLPLNQPEKKKGLKIIKCVEDNFMKTRIRDCSSRELVDRGRKLVQCIHKLLPFDNSENYVVALYTYHGYFNMTKLLRKTYVTVTGKEKPYTPEQREQGYNQLKRQWINNPWIRYGVALAGLFKKT